MVQLKYTGSFDLWFPKLKFFSGGKMVKKGEIIKVDESVANSILKTRGKLFEVVKETKKQLAEE